MIEARHALSVQTKLAEGPVWHAGALWFVDIEGHRLHRFDPAAPSTSPAGARPAQRHQSWDAGQRIGCAIPARDGSWILGLQAGVARWRPGLDQPTILHTPEAGLGTRFNDGKADPMGRAFLGTMHLSIEPAKASLYRLDPEPHPAGTLTRILDRVTISNGLAWQLDPNATRPAGPASSAAPVAPPHPDPPPHESGLMYYIDTPTRRIDVMAWDHPTGCVSDRRVAHAFAEGLGSPDGMCIDSVGMLWVGMWGGSAVLRVDPVAGRVIDRIPIPAANVTSCCLGGPKLQTLYITTASVGLSPEQREKQPLAGDIFEADITNTGATGLPADLFG